MKLPVLLWLFILTIHIASAHDSLHVIKVHFLYGSKPAKDQEQENKWFGGLHGGHVSIEVDGEVIGFVPAGEVHVFSNKKVTHSTFVREDISSWTKDSATLKYTTIEIPVSEDQYRDIKSIQAGYLQHAPYDYAFFGMRCAAATYNILGKTGIVKQKMNFTNATVHFYPKLLRKKMLKLAKKKGYRIVSHKGRVTRKWEKD